MTHYIESERFDALMTAGVPVTYNWDWKDYGVKDVWGFDKKIEERDHVVLKNFYPKTEARKGEYTQVAQLMDWSKNCDILRVQEVCEGYPDKNRTPEYYFINHIWF